MSQVTAVLERARKNDAGYCSFLADDVWYGTYKTDYSELEGKTVTFEATQKGEYWNAKQVKPSADAPAKPAAGPAPSSDFRQKTITLQSSYKTAAELLNGLIAGDKVSLGAKGKAFDAARGLLDELALHVYFNCIDPDSYLRAVAGGEPAGGDEEDEAWNPEEA